MKKFNFNLILIGNLLMKVKNLLISNYCSVLSRTIYITQVYNLYFPDFIHFPRFIDNLLSKIDNFSIFSFVGISGVFRI